MKILRENIEYYRFIMNNLKKILSKFFESKYFLLLLSILTVLNYYFNLGFCTYIEAAIFIILIFISNSQFLYSPSLLVFVLAGGITKIPDFKSAGFIIFSILMSIIIIVFIIDIVKKRKEIVKITCSNSFIISNFLLIFIMLLSLITSVDRITSIAAIVGFLINPLFMYLVLLNTKIDDSTKDNLGYSFVAIFYVIFMMFLIRFFEVLTENGFKKILFDKAFFNFEWCHSNHYCSILCISSIFGLYLTIKKFKESNILNKIVWLFPIVGTVLICIFIVSRGPLFGLCASIGSFYVLTIIKYWNKKNVSIPLISILCVLIIVSFLLYFLVLKDAFGDKGLNGRQELWPVAIKHFKENLILGTGYGTQRIFIMAETPQSVYNYHNYFLQISTCGILGIVAFTIYLINVIWHCFNKLSWFNIAFISIFVLFLCNGFVDTLFFSNTIMPLFSICLCYLSLKPIELKIEEKITCKLL